MFPNNPTLYFSISNGLPACIPNNFNAFTAGSLPEARKIMREAIEEFCGPEGEYGHRALDFHLEQFGNPDMDASQWSWIMAFANEGAEELTLRGLTEAEYNEIQKDEA